MSHADLPSTATALPSRSARPAQRYKPGLGLGAALVLAFAAPEASAFASPDLVANLVIGPLAAKAGDKVTVERTFLNFGAPVSGPFTFSIHLSTNTTISSADPIVDTRTGDLGHAFELLTIPESILPGNYYWGLRVHAVAGEPSTSNNWIAGGPIDLGAPPAPDLAAVSVDGPLGTIAPGSSFQVKIDVADVGGNYSGAVPYAAFVVLSTNTTITMSDTMLPGSKALTMLGPQWLAVSLPASIEPGLYHLGLVVGTNPTDTDPSDNTVKGGMISVGYPDLEAKSIAGPTQAVLGDTATVTWNVDETTGMASTFDYAIRLSTNTKITGSDPLIASGTSSAFGTKSLTVTIPTSLPIGVYYWGLKLTPAAGETVVHDNVVTGNAIVVSAPAPEPNLTAELISGAAAATVGDATSVLRNVSATDFTGSFSYEVRLSTNTTISSFDPMVANGNSSQLGAATVTATIPPSLAPGTYYWGLIVKAPVTESTAVDNWIAGNAIVVEAAPPTPLPDLSLDSMLPIAVDAVTGDTQPVVFERHVENIGGAGSTLSWTLSAPLPAWLSVTPDFGTVPAGQSQSISIAIDTDGLNVGEYLAFVKIVNAADFADTVSLQASASVGHATFTPGETITGAIASPNDVVILTFMGTEGMKLKLKVKSIASGLKLRAIVSASSGALVGDRKLTHKKKKADFKLPADGEYRLELLAAMGTGAFTLKTKAKYPKAGKSTISESGLPHVEEFYGHAGASLDAVAVATKRFTGEQIVLELRDTEGSLLHASTGLAAAEILAVPLPADGRYVLLVHGVEGEKAVKLTHELSSPEVADLALE